jgi:hypothetical protein
MVDIRILLALIIEERTSFLKKRSKRLSNACAELSEEGRVSLMKVFWFFFSKKNLLSCFPLSVFLIANWYESWDCRLRAPATTLRTSLPTTAEWEEEFGKEGSKPVALMSRQR